MNGETAEQVLAQLRHSCSHPRVVIDRAKFGARLKAMRRRARIGQNTMASRLGISGRELAYAECGHTLLSAEGQLRFVEQCMMRTQPA